VVFGAALFLVAGAEHRADDFSAGDDRGRGDRADRGADARAMGFDRRPRIPFVLSISFDLHPPDW
jgi:hypothetical protein